MNLMAAAKKKDSFMKTACAFLLLLIIAGCSRPKDNILKSIGGQWQVEEMRTAKKDFAAAARYSIMFYTNHSFSLYNNDSDKWYEGTYNLYKEKDSLKMEITHFEDKRLKGVYNVHLDTVTANTYYMLRLTLNNDKVYLNAQMGRSKQERRFRGGR